MPFNLETPAAPQLTGVTRFSGWYIPESSTVPNLVVTLDGRPVVKLPWGYPRPDVVPYFPDVPRALLCSFQGNVVSPAEPGRRVEVEILDRGNPSAPKRLYGRTYTVTEGRPAPVRKRSFSLAELLVCPDCGGKLEERLDALACRACATSRPSIQGVPHFLTPGEYPSLSLTEETSTHRYSSMVEKVLKEHARGRVLDFGAGNTPPDLLSPNVVYLDATQYRHTDLVCTGLRLPFADASFDAVVSQSVFEHVPEPWTTARELHRVLKPGGTVFIETAFMQPLHSDPGHFFNMTLHGLRRVMAPFQEVATGIQSHQRPDSALLMQLDTLLPHVKPGAWKERLERWRAELAGDAQGLNAALSEVGVEVLSAGVYFLGTRPDRIAGARGSAGRPE